jgi:hypothetical protein
MLRRVAASGVLVLALSASAVAQTAPAGAPPARGAAFAERGTTFALRGAYRAIAEAQARGASTYLDAAKNHYRDALARLQRHDPGAAGEALAAAALARAAVAEHPIPAPRDIPPPPSPAPELAAGVPAAPMPMQAPRGGRRMHHRPGGMIGGRFDPAKLAADAKLANTAEARDLAQKALDADLARARAAFGGNADEALREGRLAGALAMAVRSLALADHPASFMRARRPPAGGPPART